MKLSKSERSAFMNAVNALEKSAIVSWKEGDVHTWADWALRMKNTINSTTSIIRGMVENSENEESLNNISSNTENIQNNGGIKP